MLWVQTSNKAFPLSTNKNRQTTQQTDRTITTQAQQSKTHLNMALNTFQKAQTYSEKRLRDSFCNQTLNITVQKLVDPIKHCISFFSYIQEKKQILYPFTSFWPIFIHCFSPLGVTLHFSLVPFVLFGCSHLYKSSVRCVATTLRRWCVLYKSADPYSFFFFFFSFILLWIVTHL